jgi:hypothetical protein
MWVERDSFRLTLMGRFMAISMSPMHGASEDHYFVASHASQDMRREPKYLVLEYLDYIRR